MQGGPDGQPEEGPQGLDVAALVGGQKPLKDNKGILSYESKSHLYPPLNQQKVIMRSSVSQMTHLYSQIRPCCHKPCWLCSQSQQLVNILFPRILHCNRNVLPRLELVPVEAAVLESDSLSSRHLPVGCAANRRVHADSNPEH